MKTKRYQVVGGELSRYEDCYDVMDGDEVVARFMGMSKDNLQRARALAAKLNENQ